MFRVHSSRLIGVLSLFAMVGLPGAPASTTYPAGYDWHAADPLLYGHLVVEARIAGVELKEVADEQLGFQPGTGPPPWIGILELDGPKLLRGGPFSSPIAVNLFIDWRDVVGSRVVICADWLPKLGSYLVRDEKSVFFLKDSKWERLDPREVMTDSELKSGVAKTLPETVAQRADVVITGKITSLADSVVTVGEERIKHGYVRTITMDVSETMKGVMPRRIVSFFAYSWVEETPLHLEVGGDWVAFLERRGDAMWLVGGTNGLLRVEGKDRLLYDGYAPHPFSKSQLTRMIKDESNGE